MPEATRTDSSGECLTTGPIDFCKTPTPGGPVPMPYMNTAKTSDGKGSKKVKVSGDQALRKGDKILMSSKDEAGTAMGAVSSKIKGKAEFMVGSPFVKVQGKHWAHHGVPMMQNDGNTAGVHAKPCG
jgi:uncharacterized Zn-binding protein involved in type VI secretion